MLWYDLSAQIFDVHVWILDSCLLTKCMYFLNVIVNFDGGLRDKENDRNISVFIYSLLLIERIIKKTINFEIHTNFKVKLFTTHTLWHN